MCGVIGLISKEDVVISLYNALGFLQHRGQEGAGIVTFDQFHSEEHPGVYREKGLGLVSEVFNELNLGRLKGNWGIGHTRYATAGKVTIDDTQPMFTTSPELIAMAYNGNIVNYVSLREKIKNEKQKANFSTCDLEVILNFFAEGLKGKEINFDNICNSVNEIYEEVIGSYSVVGLIANKGMVAFRDPKGIMPLLYGFKDVNGKKSYGFASENYSLNDLNFKDIKDLPPGVVAFVDDEYNLNLREVIKGTHSHCAFQWVYFSRYESFFEGVYSDLVREKLGITLADKINNSGVQADLIVPIPSTSISAAHSLAHQLEIRHKDAIQKNPNVGRTFIEGDEKIRNSIIKKKYIYAEHILRDNSIILVDDSIVRGATLKAIVKKLRQIGVRRVYGASTFPPIRNSCYYGIDQNRQELVANKKNELEISQELGLDGLFYNTIEDVKWAIGLDDLCMACCNGIYPTDISESKVLEELRKKDKLKI